MSDRFKGWIEGANLVIAIMGVMLLFLGIFWFFTETLPELKAKEYCEENGFEDAKPYFNLYRCENRTLSSDGVGYDSIYSDSFGYGDIK